MTYTPKQVDAVARRIYEVTSARLAREGHTRGVTLHKRIHYPLNHWARCYPGVKAFYRKWARRSLGMA